MNTSQDLRKQGNSHYEKFQRSTNFQDQKYELENSIRLYYRAYETARDVEDLTSAAKNYGTASWKLAGVLQTTNGKADLIQFHYKESLKYIGKALQPMRLSSKSKEWIEGVQRVYVSCASEALEQLESLPFTQRMHDRELLIELLGEDVKKAECYCFMVTDLFQAGVVALGNRDFREALKYFHDCHRPLEECHKLSTTCKVGSLVNEMKVKREELIFSLASAESQQAIFAGMTNE